MFKLFVRDGRARCPICGGLVTSYLNEFCCVDCRAEFTGVEEGYVENEVMVEQRVLINSGLEV